MAVSAIKKINRGEIGVQAMTFALKTDTLAGIASSLGTTELMLLTDQDRMVRVPVEEIPVCRRDEAGDRLFKLAKKEKVDSVIVVTLPEAEDEAEDDAELAETSA
jgi:DNA gyrase subunit A